MKHLFFLTRKSVFFFGSRLLLALMLLLCRQPVLAQIVPKVPGEVGGPGLTPPPPLIRNLPRQL